MHLASPALALPAEGQSSATRTSGRYLSRLQPLLELSSHAARRGTGKNDWLADAVGPGPAGSGSSCYDALPVAAVAAVPVAVASGYWKLLCAACLRGMPTNAEACRLTPARRSVVPEKSGLVRSRRGAPVRCPCSRLDL